MCGRILILIKPALHMCIAKKSNKPSYCCTIFKTQPTGAFGLRTCTSPIGFPGPAAALQECFRALCHQENFNAGCSTAVSKHHMCFLIFPFSYRSFNESSTFKKQRQSMDASMQWHHFHIIIQHLLCARFFSCILSLNLFNTPETQG